MARHFMSPPSARTVVAYATMLLLASVALAQQAPPAPAAAKYAELSAQEDQRAGDPEFDYQLGVAALDSGHLTRAIFALERSVAERPNDPMARAELGRAYLAAGETASAREAFERVRQADVPPGASEAIDRVLGMLDQVAPELGPRYSGYLELGGGWDSNVNSANTADQFAIPAFGGLLLTVDPDSRQRHDVFATVAAGGGLRRPLDPDWTLLAGANARVTANRQAHDVNTQVVDASVGASHAKEGQVVTVAVQANAAWVGSSLYRTSYGASGQWQSQIDKSSQLTGFVQASRQDYSGQRERNTDRAVLGAGYARQFELGGPLAYGSVYGVREHAREAGFDHFGHHGVGARLGLEQPFTHSAIGFVEWQYEHRRYGGQEPLFDRARADGQTDLLAGVRYAPAPGWQVLPQARYTRAASNVALYDYTRTVFQITLRLDFQ